MLREGREEGLRTGINYGELQNLVRMVLKKMRKDVSCEITAELFEEPVEKIRKIYEVPYRWIWYSIRYYSVKEARDERDRRIRINKE